MDTVSQAAPPLPRHPRLSQILEQNWQAEMTGHYTYRALAQREREPGRKQALENMALAEKEHAALWAGRLRELGEPDPVYRGKPAGDADSLKNRIGGDDLALRRLEIDESRDIAKYSQQLKALGDAPSLAILERVIEDEQDHYRELSSLIRRYPPRPVAGSDVRATELNPKALLEQLLAKRNQGRSHTAGWIGDAIYGVNDGLGAVFGIVSGMAGYTGGSEVVLAAGLAGMLASALSMGAGAYLSSKSQREVYESEIAREQAEIDEDPHEELLELELFYQLKGFSAEESRTMAERLQKEPKQFLRTLVHEELGLNEDTFPNPWRSTLSASVSTAIGGFIPIIPFFFTVGMPAVIASFVISTIAHFLVGASKSLVTTRSWWASGTEMTVVGVIEAAVTYGLGVAFAGH
jgi:VIT1/CCC1 family predicted Fe2+/Mn2+ transporter